MSAVSDIYLATDDSHMLVVGAHGFSLYEHTRDIQKQMGNLALKLAIISIVHVKYMFISVQVTCCMSAHNTLVGLYDCSSYSPGMRMVYSQNIIQGEAEAK